MTALDHGFLTKPIAHRALHELSAGRPENSRAAIRAAIDHGYGIEIDLQLSRDGVAMVFHDEELARLTGESGSLRARDADELSCLTLLGSQETIPAFQDVLTLVAGQVPLLVELKDQHGALGETDGRLEAAVTRDIAGYKGPLALMSFNPHMMVALADLAPDVPRGLVTCHFPEKDWPEVPGPTRARLRDIPDYARAAACFVSHQRIDLQSAAIDPVRAQGGHVLAWTIRSEAQEQEARAFADNVTFEGYLPAVPS